MMIVISTYPPSKEPNLLKKYPLKEPPTYALSVKNSIMVENGHWLDIGVVFLLLTIFNPKLLHFLSKSRGRHSKGGDFGCSYVKCIHYHM